MSAQHHAPCWLTVKEAAGYLRTRDEAVREAIARGDLPAWRPAGQGRGLIVHTDDLDAYVRGTYDPAMALNAARRVVARAAR